MQIKNEVEEEKNKKQEVLTTRPCVCVFECDRSGGTIKRIVLIIIL